MNAIASRILLAALLWLPASLWAAQRAAPAAARSAAIYAPVSRESAVSALKFLSSPQAALDGRHPVVDYLLKAKADSAASRQRLAPLAARLSAALAERKLDEPDEQTLREINLIALDAQEDVRSELQRLMLKAGNPRTSIKNLDRTVSELHQLRLTLSGYLTEPAERKALRRTYRHARWTLLTRRMNLQARQIRRTARALGMTAAERTSATVSAGYATRGTPLSPSSRPAVATGAATHAPIDWRGRSHAPSRGDSPEKFTWSGLAERAGEHRAVIALSPLYYAAFVWKLEFLGVPDAAIAALSSAAVYLGVKGVWHGYPLVTLLHLVVFEQLVQTADAAWPLASTPAAAAAVSASGFLAATVANLSYRFHRPAAAFTAAALALAAAGLLLSLFASASLAVWLALAVLCLACAFLVAML